MANLDHYLPCENYAGQNRLEQYPGFAGWFNESDGNWYFAAVTNFLGAVVLRSESYTSEAGRNNGIESVMRNRDIEERYDVIEDGGEWFVILRAGNRQEIARSCGYGSEAEARMGIVRCKSDYVESEASTRRTADRSDVVIEDYLDCGRYSGHENLANYPGFTGWQDTDSGLYYFALVGSTGDVLLRSEGYTTESARNNGIESVNRNRDIEEHYRVVEENGEWFICLRAGNNQEIARSCAFDSEGAAAADIIRRRSDYVEPAARAARTADRSNVVVEDYLGCDSYAGHAGMDAYPGFTGWMDAESGLYYFALVSASGNILLRSEGYTTEAARNNGIESVMRNRDLPERYKVVEENGEYFLCLRAGNNQEIGRSCAYESAAAATDAIMRYNSSFVESTARASRTPIVIEDYLHCNAYRNRPALKYDNFTGWQDEESKLYYFAYVDGDGKVILKSEGYTTEASRNNGVESVIRNYQIKERWIQRKDDDGYYYGLIAGNRQEIARTCHFESESAMLGWWMPFSMAWGGTLVDVESKPELESFTVESRAIETPVTVEVAEEMAPIVVPDVVIEPEPEQEVIIEEPIVDVPEVAAIPLIVPEIEVPKEEYVPQWKKKEEKTVIYTKPVEEPVVVPPITTRMEAEPERGGGFNWWWLLPLLLLGLLLYFMKGCDGCAKKTEVAPPPPPVETPKVDPPAPVEPAKPAGCNCNASTHPVFTQAHTGAPKSLKKLGTSPEFGNSHSYDAKGFFEKLTRRHKNNPTDRKFLDEIFKEMGYANGFADAKAEQFTSVTLTSGTVGNMGYSPTHKTIYASLDTQGKDLEAFRIDAANGCDLHFMKTCGNHFFFCETK